MSLEAEIENEMNAAIADALKLAKELDEASEKDINAEVGGYVQAFATTSDAIRLDAGIKALHAAILRLAHEIDLIAAPRRTEQ